MKDGFWYRFAIRWLVCGLGIWIASGLFDSYISFETSGSVLVAVIISGLILAIVNTLIKPLLVFLALPALLLTLGLFMVVINGFTVFLVGLLYDPLHVANFWGAILAGVIIGLVNYLVTVILENRKA